MMNVMITRQRVVRTILRRLRRLSRKNYYTAKAFHHFNLHLEGLLSNKSPIYLYQMGKVGSSTVFTSLRAMGLSMPIHHIHYLSQHYLDTNEQFYKDHYIEHNPQHHWNSQYVCGRMDKGLYGEKLRIITLL